MKLTYHWQGGYQIPDLVPPESQRIGIWGERRRQYLRTHQKPIYDAMLMNETLNAHLEEVDRLTEQMMEQLTAQLAAQEDITESLKAGDQRASMNSIYNLAKEIVSHNSGYKKNHNGRDCISLPL